MGPESRDDFRVAIICALSLEADAVLDLFDQHYDNDGSKYGKQEGDTNTYTTGRFGPHDVVLVHMPGMGVNNASMSAITLTVIRTRNGKVMQQQQRHPLQRLFSIWEFLNNNIQPAQKAYPGNG
jgi:hypothetical protein